MFLGRSCTKQKREQGETCARFLRLLGSEERLAKIGFLNPSLSGIDRVAGISRFV
jgi:hypothetical protein